MEFLTAMAIAMFFIAAPTVVVFVAMARDNWGPFPLLWRRLRGVGGTLRWSWDMLGRFEEWVRGVRQPDRLDWEEARRLSEEYGLPFPSDPSEELADWYERTQTERFGMSQSDREDQFVAEVSDIPPKDSV